MGRGKTSAAMNYMARMSPEHHFLYVTPYLKEVDRICDCCEFNQPNGDHSSKLTELKSMMYRNRNVATTHALFYLLDDEVLRIARERHYSVIIDEALNVIQHVNVTKRDREIILELLADVGEDGSLSWRDPEYSGKFSGYKDLADNHSLFLKDTSFIHLMNPDVLRAFDEVVMMTYLFQGQYQRAYLDFFGIPYQICGVHTDDGFEFSDQPDAPPPIDYRSLIHIVDADDMNNIGDPTFSLSKAWYDRRTRESEDMTALRRNLTRFFRKSECGSQGFMWTCYKDDVGKMLGKNNRMFSSFLQLASKASNEYRNRYVLAYLVNRFIDPNIAKFFAAKGIAINQDEFALGELLQWIWRSAIRDDKPIDLYIPSQRMRSLLEDWINNNSNGGST